MLADNLIEAPRVMQNLIEPQRICYTELAQRVRSAPRFVLDRAAVHFLQNTAEMNPLRFLTALPICRMPYPRMWIEFTYKDRDDWLKMAVTRGASVKENPEAYPPSRLGFYLEQQDRVGRFFHVTPVWSHPSSPAEIEKGFDPLSVSVCSLTQEIDASDEATPDPAHRARIRAALQDRLLHPQNENFDRYLHGSSDVELLCALESRINVTIADFMLQFWLWISKHQADSMEKLRSFAEFDLLAEWKFILALLISINSRNIIRLGEEINYDRLNKARIAKGKAPLLSHREIKLSLSRVQRNRMGSDIGGHRDLAAHIVEGHWKVRKSGLYWWNTHARGTVGTAPIPTSKVTA